MKINVKIVYVPDGEGSYEPGMHLSKPVNRSLIALPFGQKKVRGYIIALSALHDYVDDRHLFAKSIDIAEYIGLSTKNKSEVYAVATAINDNIDKVCNAYEYGQVENSLETHKHIAGDIDVMIDGETVAREHEMIERDERVLVGE